MPELPEAETIVRDLREPLTGRRFRRVDVLRPDVVHGPVDAFAATLAGRRVKEVGRRGKNIVLRFEHDSPRADPRLVVNLGMTGNLLLPRPGTDPTQPGHPGVQFLLDDGRTLWYNDPRRFGRLEAMNAHRWREWSGGLGPEPLSSTLSASDFHLALRRSNTPMRSWLLDQKRIAGVGNIYASEALYGARIHPLRRASSLTLTEARSLHRSLRQVLRRAIANRGTTLQNYRDLEGQAGGNRPQLRAYGRVGLPCFRCRTPMERIVISNRSAFFCPRCQPGPE